MLNTGTLAVTGVTDTGSLQHIGGIAGFVDLSGTLINTGATLDGATLTQIFRGLGTIQGGTVTNIYGTGPATLDGVTWVGPLEPQQTNLTILDGLTLIGAGGSGPGTLQLSGTLADPGLVTFVGDQSFDAASVSGRGTISTDATLTLGTTASFTEVPSEYSAFPTLEFGGSGTIINLGTIYAQSSEHLISVGYLGSLAFTGGQFDNFGVIDAYDYSAPNPGAPPGGLDYYVRGTVVASINAGSFTNHAGGLIEIGQSVGVAALTISAATAFTNDGTLLTQDGMANSVAGGTIDIAGFLAGSGLIGLSGGGTVELGGAVSSSQTLDFIGAGTLILDQPSFVPALINAFNADDLIRLGVVASAISYSSGDLKLQIGGGGTFDLAITGPYALSDFIITPGSASTDIQIACFAAGTRIATRQGAVAVEHLQEGDEVLLADGRGAALPVRWIGHRALDCRRHPDPRQIWPVRIAAGAFAPQVPQRDLYLSPDHAVFACGVLIPVKYLVNGRSVQQVAVDQVAYWHVELPRHAALLAEGLSVESLLPGSDRSGFANGGEVVALHPAFSHWTWESAGFAPLMVTGPAVEQARALLARRVARRRRAV